MSAMAEVLAAHQWYDATTDNEDPATGCTGCPDWFGSEDALDDGAYAAHQAEMLTAAGFGPVKEAGAKALEEAAAVVSSEESEQWDRASENLPGAQIVARRMLVVGKILRARAAAVRGEG